MEKYNCARCGTELKKSYQFLVGNCEFCKECGVKLQRFYKKLNWVERIGGHYVYQANA